VTWSAFFLPVEDFILRRRGRNPPALFISIFIGETPIGVAVLEKDLKS